MPPGGEVARGRERPKFFTAYSFGIVTAALFLLSWVGQFAFQLIETRNDAATHGEQFEMAQFWPAFLSATFENWQSEFLQLVWQAAGLAIFFFWGSSQSGEGNERLEAKVDRLLREQGVDPTEYDYREERDAERQERQSP